MLSATLQRLVGRGHFAPAAPAAAPPVETPRRKPSAAEEAVRRGGEMLAERLPGWHHFISLASLDVSSGFMCVLGQLAQFYPGAQSFVVHNPADTPYGNLATGLGVSGKGVKYGFVCSEKATYSELTQAWRDYIVALRTR